MGNKNCAEGVCVNGKYDKAVNHPKHYALRGGIEVIDLAEQFNFNIGNVIKYVCRAGKKDDAMQDLLKAKWYLEREIATRKRYAEEADTKAVLDAEVQRIARESAKTVEEIGERDEDSGIGINPIDCVKYSMEGIEREKDKRMVDWSRVNRLDGVRVATMAEDAESDKIADKEDKGLVVEESTTHTAEGDVVTNMKIMCADGNVEEKKVWVGKY